MKKKNYVHKTLTLKCDLCDSTLRVRKAELNDLQINAVYNHYECLCSNCLYKSPKAFDYRFIRYHYGFLKTFDIFPKTVSIQDIKRNREKLKSAKLLSNALLSENFGKDLKRQYLKCQMAARNLKVIK